MPVSVVVGGQFGSEGKGKVALDLALRERAAAVIRVGGSNSGHTAASKDGELYSLRQIPASALAPDTLVILPPGSIIDPDILDAEVHKLSLDPNRLIVDPMATVIGDVDITKEKQGGLTEAIGSTGSGTGAALQRRLSRLDSSGSVLAKDHRKLRPYLGSTNTILRSLLDEGRRIIIEGTQGFGLSVLHGGYYPHATSRDTIASSFVAEAGLSPLDVDSVCMVLRTYPIRVAGKSGPLKGETSWGAVAKRAGLPADHHELTTATRNVRRIGAFDPELVRRAISANMPTEIVLNHLDYIDVGVRDGQFSDRVLEFVAAVEKSIGRTIAWLGVSRTLLIPRSTLNVPDFSAVA